MEEELIATKRRVEELDVELNKTKRECSEMAAEKKALATALQAALDKMGILRKSLSEKTASPGLAAEAKNLILTTRQSAFHGDAFSTYPFSCVTTKLLISQCAMFKAKEVPVARALNQNSVP